MSVVYLKIINNTDIINYICRRKNNLDWPPIIKIKLVLKNSNIGIEPPWNDVKQSLRTVIKNARKSSETLTRWGFYHMEVMSNL